MVTEEHMLIAQLFISLVICIAVFYAWRHSKTNSEPLKSNYRNFISEYLQIQYVREARNKIAHSLADNNIKFEKSDTYDEFSEKASEVCSVYRTVGVYLSRKLIDKSDVEPCKQNTLDCYRRCQTLISQKQTDSGRDHWEYFAHLYNVLK